MSLKLNKARCKHNVIFFLLLLFGSLLTALDGRRADIWDKLKHLGFCHEVFSARKINWEFRKSPKPFWNDGEELALNAAQLWNSRRYDLWQEFKKNYRALNKLTSGNTVYRLYDHISQRFYRQFFFHLEVIFLTFAINPWCHSWNEFKKPQINALSCQNLH